MACGNWVGNPKDEDAKNTPKQMVNAEQGEVILHRLKLSASDPTTLKYKIQTPLSLLATDKQDFEISIVNEQGLEEAYSRKTSGEFELDFVPKAAGDYSVLIKNNAASTAEMSIEGTTGLEEESGLSNLSAENESQFKDIAIKAVVSFAKNCKSYANGGNTVSVREAPAGSYFIQPFVFLGKVDLNTKTVAPLSSATISIVSGKMQLTLNKLSDFDLAIFREFGGLTKDQHADYTRNFYGAYFGAAGEMYTTDTFRFGGDCSKAPVFELPTDVGTAKIELKVVDSSLSTPLDISIPIRPSASTAFTLYEKEGKRIDNWDPCSYDPYSAQAVNYNTPDLPCRKLSVRDAPYVTLDYKLPSADSSLGLSRDSDPTRILYYGHSLAKDFKKQVIDQQDALRGVKSTIDLDRCLSNGGLHAVPVSTEKTYLPLGEFNTRTGDLIQLARKTGSYTALKEFYQGNVSLSGSISYPTCIPNSSTKASCDSFKILQVQVSKCSIKADSGISTTSVGENFIYPEYFEMSGEIGD